MTRALQDYHGDRWALKGNFGNLRRIAWSLDADTQRLVNELENRMQTKLKERYEAEKPKPKQYQ